MNRRQFLRRGSPAILAITAGCSSSTDSENTTPPESSSRSPTSTPTKGPTETENATPTTTKDATPPEPDYVVASDGSGDYEKLTKALEIVQDGDVLAVKSGDYTYNPKGSESGFDTKITLVGTDPESTTLMFEPPASLTTDDDIKVDDVHGASKETAVESNIPDFYNLNLDISNDIALIFGQARYTKEATLHGCIFSGKFMLYGMPNITDCRFTQFAFLNGNSEARRAVFDGDLHLDTHGAVYNSKINATVHLGSMYKSGTGGTVSNSVITPPSETSTAIYFHGYASDYGRVENSEIRGQIKHENWHNSGIEWEGNTFVNDGDFDYFFDTKVSGHQFYLNAFEGADLRFNSGASFYNEEEKLGNYYSAWDGGKDKDSDGISELPRAIPGNSDVTDQYPLMEPDISKYRS